MKHYIPTLLLVTSFLTCSQSNSLRAQEPTEENKPRAKAVFEIDFPGGSIEEYVRFLRTCPNQDNDNNPTPVNILVTERAKNFQLPASILFGRRNKSD